jgi:16S rRNA (cytosine967-C5)-methyltransferase
MANTAARTRAVAAEIVDAVATGGRSLDAAIARFEARVGPDDRSLLRMLCFGTLRNYWQLQQWIGQLINRPLKKRDRVVNALLAVGLFQLCDTRIPDHAAVSQTVEAARLLRRPKLAGLLNACMRRFQRENLADARGGSDEALWNHPQWLIDHLRADWRDDAEAILTANNARAPMWLRVNSSRQSAAEYRRRLAAVAIDAELSRKPWKICRVSPTAMRPCKMRLRRSRHAGSWRSHRNAFSTPVLHPEGRAVIYTNSEVPISI